MQEHFGSSAVMSQRVPLALNPSVKNGQLVLVVCVDDFKMAGPQKNLAQGWSIRLKIEPETGLDTWLYSEQGDCHPREWTPCQNGPVSTAILRLRAASS